MEQLQLRCRAFLFYFCFVMVRCNGSTIIVLRSHERDARHVANICGLLGNYIDSLWRRNSWKWRYIRPSVYMFRLLSHQLRIKVDGGSQLATRMSRISSWMMQKSYSLLFWEVRFKEFSNEHFVKLLTNAYKLGYSAGNCFTGSVLCQLRQQYQK